MMMRRSSGLTMSLACLEAHNNLVVSDYNTITGNGMLTTFGNLVAWSTSTSVTSVTGMTMQFDDTVSELTN